MINRNAIERRFKVTPSDPLGRGWEVVLSVSWFARAKQKTAIVFRL